MGQAASKDNPSEEQAKKQRHRKEVVREIATTEQNYVQCLHVCMEVFMQPLELAVEQGKPIIKEQDIRTIFSIVKLLHQIHEPFADEMQQCVDKYDDKKPFAHIFVNHYGLFKVYTDYVNNYNRSLTTLSELCRDNRNFASFLSTAYLAPECRGRDLPNFLIAPIQRLPRYVLLLQELLKATPAKHKDHKARLHEARTAGPRWNNVAEALAKIKLTTEYINREKRFAENFQKLVEIQNAFGNDLFLTKSPQRELLQEGDYMCKKKGSRKGWTNLHYFLFNDVLVFARPRVGLASTLFAGGGSWSLENYAYLPDTDLKDHADTKEDQHIVGLVMADKQEYLVKFPSAGDKEGCISQFYTIRSKAHRIQFTDIVAGKKKEKEKGGKKTRGEENPDSDDESEKATAKQRTKAWWGSGQTDTKKVTASTSSPSVPTTAVSKKQTKKQRKEEEEALLIAKQQEEEKSSRFFCCLLQ